MNGCALWTMAIAGTALATVASAVHVMRRRYLVVTVFGYSMTPTFRHGDRVLLRRTDRGQYRSGDVVVLQAPEESGWRHPPPQSIDGPWQIKRVAAVAGEAVPQSVARACGQPVGSPVPADHLVVIGDGAVSYDSRSWGFLPADRVLGVVLRRVTKGPRDKPEGDPVEIR